jgi:predicted transglutaminase-like cysteine proteinase
MALAGSCGFRGRRHIRGRALAWLLLAVPVHAFADPTSALDPRAVGSVSANVTAAEERLVWGAQHITFGAVAPMPYGYYELCTTQPGVCEPSSGSVDAGVHLDRQRLSQLVTVNAQVNRSIRKVDDIALYDVSDRWTIDPPAGDCEDFALTKKARLTAMGWPSSALLIALAWTPAGVEHAVLVARTDRGDFVLDSLKKEIRGWRPSLYRWASIQSPTDAWTWYSFGSTTRR